ncbi:MAG: hypothetical protein KatS3mg095_0981 [Candidatus Parcubacteria bacterium]|nr:MAG: hypothetical protein KatS3mg095_0981 [Candidatus Parcubacteria bacterium]
MKTPQIDKNIKNLLKEFGFLSEKEFVNQAVEEKILELKKLKFLLVSQKIRKGLKKKGLTPEKLLKYDNN